VRAGELVNVSLIEGGEDVLRQTATAIFGKDVVKSGLKKMKSCEYAKSALPVFWMCLKLWSKMASSDEVSEGYTNNAEELVMVAKGDEDGLKVLLDQLLAHLSQPLKYHRTVVYYVFVQLLPHFKKEHVSHIIETMMMDDDELADEEGSEGESSNDEDEEMDDGEAAAEQSESESIDDEEMVDPETLNRLESALGKAAVKRKGDAIDEEEVSP
ncbi:hypothetical protein TELCIR_21397, partial [Teladorsagia circumcincta]